MAFSDVLRREKVRDDFLAAFAAANPGKEPPTLTYEAGWWCFRYRITGMVADRVRQRRLEEMTARLRARVSDTP